MPKNKDLKRRVRARMRKTGESYTAARRQVVAAKPGPRADLAAVAGMSDAAVQAKTGRSWAQWVAVLDAVDAAAMAHRDIARHLREQHGTSSWWSQMVTVGYERIRGLREKGQRRGGTFDVNKSKTLPVAVGDLYAAFAAAARRRWLGDVAARVKTATPAKSMRLAWPDGTAVNVNFWSKGAARSQVQIQHGGLPTRADAERQRAFWNERLLALAAHLRGR